MDAQKEETIRYLSKVYLWMFFALIITGLTGWFTAPLLLQFLSSPTFQGWSSTVQQVALFLPMVMWLVFAWSLAPLMRRSGAALITVLLILFSAFTGFTFSYVFAFYTTASIGLTFLIASAMFAAMSLFGYFTKMDLTSWGPILGMAVLGLIIASVVNFFLQSPLVDYIASGIGIVVFSALVAYHTQTIVKHNVMGNEGTLEDFREVVIGAGFLYIDFINLFMDLLRFFGKRK
ncbi:BAX inhibitor (BI)-1/YccA family protein [Candidatus Woesearchaeota archaeon]|nr:BAX inhibitor (BI)-1/YccA family protein [Candidatus Woesearchaeota archaeon]